MLRSEADLDDYGLYIFLNPYHAALLDASETWPGWHCPWPSCFNFTQQLNADGTPPHEWIGLPVPEGLVTGE